MAIAVPDMKDILVPVLVSSLIGVGSAAMTIYKAIPSIQLQMDTVIGRVDKADRRDEAFELEIRAMHEMRGEINGLTEELKALREDLRADRTLHHPRRIPSFRPLPPFAPAPVPQPKDLDRQQ